MRLPTILSTLLMNTAQHNEETLAFPVLLENWLLITSVQHVSPALLSSFLNKDQFAMHFLSFSRNEDVLIRNVSLQHFKVCRDSIFKIALSF